jgi:DNA-3-methyladenine glycosylase II
MPVIIAPVSPPPAPSTAVRVTPRPPFDFGRSLDFLASFPATRGEQRLEPGAVTYAVREAGVVAAVRICAEGTELVYALSAPGALPAEAVAAIADRLSFRFSVDDDLAPLYALAAADPPFAAVVERLHGLHQVKLPSPLELMVWAILGQRAPLPVARRCKQAIVGSFAENRVVVDGDELWAFPDLAQLRTLTLETLTELIANARKAGYLHAAFGHWAQIDEAFLRAGDYDAVHERLLAIPGIGPWSAAFLLIRGLGRMERMPVDREGIRAAAAAYDRPALSDAEFARLADSYGECQAYWGHYLRAAG